MYVLHPRLVIPFSCIHKISEMYGNTSMSTCTSHHIPHLHVDGVVDIMQTLSALEPYLGRSMTWVEGIPIYRLQSRLVRSFICTCKPCEKYGDQSMATCTSHHIPHLPDDGLVVCRSYKILGHSFGGLWSG